MVILLRPKGCKPDNFESHNSLTLSFTNICSLHSIFDECEFLLQLGSPDIPNLDDPIDSSNFSVMGYLPSIQKDSITHIHGLSIYVREGPMFSNSFTTLSVLLVFPLLMVFCNSLCMVFDSISFNIDEFLSVNPSDNVFVFGDFLVHHKHWLTYSGRTDRSDEILNDLIQTLF